MCEHVCVSVSKCTLYSVVRYNLHSNNNMPSHRHALKRITLVDLRRNAHTRTHRNPFNSERRVLKGKKSHIKSAKKFRDTSISQNPFHFTLCINTRRGAHTHSRCCYVSFRFIIFLLFLNLFPISPNNRAHVLNVSHIWHFGYENFVLEMCCQILLTAPATWVVHLGWDVSGANVLRPFGVSERWSDSKNHFRFFFIVETICFNLGNADDGKLWKCRYVRVNIRVAEIAWDSVACERQKSHTRHTNFDWKLIHFVIARTLCFAEKNFRTFSQLYRIRCIPIHSHIHQSHTRLYAAQWSKSFLLTWKWYNI